MRINDLALSFTVEWGERLGQVHDPNGIPVQPVEWVEEGR